MKKNLLFTLFTVGSLQALSQNIIEVGSGKTYTKLGAAIAAINNGTITGNIELQITSDITENSALIDLVKSGVGSAQYSAISIYPTVANAVVESAEPILLLNGVQNVTIDGRLNRSGSERHLTFHTLTLGKPYTINLSAGARYNTIKYCKIYHASPLGNSILNFASAGSNDSANHVIENIIDNNEFKYTNIANTNGGTNAISLQSNTRNNTIINNHFIDIFHKNTSSRTSVIHVANYTYGHRILNNHFYHTNTAQRTGNSMFASIYVGGNPNNATNDYHVISGNFIGGTADSCQGTSMIINTLATSEYAGIYIEGTDYQTQFVEVSNNMIANIDFQAPSNLHRVFSGIHHKSGLANIHNNVIGTNSPSTSIKITANAKGNHTYGILSETATSNIYDNYIAGISLLHSTYSNGTTSYSNFFGIAKTHTDNVASAAQRVVNIYNNTIGHPNFDSTIVSTSQDTSATPLLVGVYVSDADSFNITNNSIHGLRMQSIQKVATGGGTYGIFSWNNGVDGFIANNYIKNLYSASSAIAMNRPTIAGIAIYSQNSKPMKVFNNHINGITGVTTHQLLGTYSSNINIAGIAMSTSFTIGNTNPHMVNGNFIEHLQIESDLLYSITRGIVCFQNGKLLATNNIIKLNNSVGECIGIDNTDIYDALSAHNNTIAIARAKNPLNTIVTGISVNIRNAWQAKNNILVNYRADDPFTNASNPFLITYMLTPQVTGTLPKPTYDHNMYFKNAQGEPFRIRNYSFSTLNTWAQEVGNETNSVFEEPQFVDLWTGDSPEDLKISNYISGANLSNLYTIDFDSIPRTNYTVGAYEMGAPLSITDLNLQVKNIGTVNHIQWTHVNSEHIKKYVVEKSEDLTSWNTIKELSSEFNSSYSAYDHNLKLKNYYRIKVISNSDKVTFSEIKAQHKNQHIHISTYPNPVKKVLAINIDNYEKANIEIYDFSGQLVQKVNNYTPNSFISVQTLPAGIYIVRINIGAETKSIQIIKQ